LFSLTNIRRGYDHMHTGSRGNGEIQAAQEIVQSLLYTTLCSIHKVDLVVMTSPIGLWTLCECLILAITIFVVLKPGSALQLE